MRLELHPDNQEWIGEQRSKIRDKLRGNITRFAHVAGVRVTDIYMALLRLRPLSPRVARRLSYLINNTPELSRIHWVDFINPVDAVNPLFAPLHPMALEAERIREHLAIRKY